MDIAIIIIFGVILFASVYGNFNLIKKCEKLDEDNEKKDKYIKALSTAINEADKRLKEIDSKGIFKNDDEIGWIFKNILYIQELLNMYNLNEDRTDTPREPEIIYKSQTQTKEEAQAKNY